MTKLNKIAHVTWKDACSSDTRNIEKTYFDNKENRSIIMQTAGYVLKDDKEGVVLVQECRLDDDSVVTRSLSIPKQYIIKKKIFKVNAK